MSENNIDDYDVLLTRAREKLPEEISHHERFQVPPVDSFVEGNTTIFRNFPEIVDTLNRDSDRLLKFLLRELGTAGEIEESGRIIFKGKLGSKKIEEKIDNFVERYVLCTECGKPDTRLSKEDRITILQCDACGAHRPIRGKKRKVQAIEDKDLRPGEVCDVLIQDIGREGDGVARQGKYVIYVPGTTKGEMVKVRINNVSGTLAFGTLVGEGSS